MIKYTCEICGREMTSESEDGLMKQAKNHLINDHGLRRNKDTTQPNIAYEEDELREKFEEE